MYTSETSLRLSSAMEEYNVVGVIWDSKQEWSILLESMVVIAVCLVCSYYHLLITVSMLPLLAYGMLIIAGDAGSSIITQASTGAPNECMDSTLK